MTPWARVWKLLVWASYAQVLGVLFAATLTIHMVAKMEETTSMVANEHRLTDIEANIRNMREDVEWIKKLGLAVLGGSMVQMVGTLMLRQKGK